MMFLLFNRFLGSCNIRELAGLYDRSDIDDIKIINPLSIIVTGTVKAGKFESSKGRKFLILTRLRAFMLSSFRTTIAVQAAETVQAVGAIMKSDNFNGWPRLSLV